jgi:hypothetical protein
VLRSRESEPPRTRTWNLEIKSLCRQVSGRCCGLHFTCKERLCLLEQHWATPGHEAGLVSRECFESLTNVAFIVSNPTLHVQRNWLSSPRPCDPFVASAPEGGGRARSVGYPAVGAAEHQDLYQLLEAGPVGDARPVGAPRVPRFPLRQQDARLLPDELHDVWWQGGHGEAPSHQRASRTPRMMEHSMPVYLPMHFLSARPLSVHRPIKAPV